MDATGDSSPTSPTAQEILRRWGSTLTLVEANNFKEMKYIIMTLNITAKAKVVRMKKEHSLTIQFKMTIRVEDNDNFTTSKTNS